MDTLLALLPSWPVWLGWISAAWVAAALLQAVYVVMQRRSPVATLGWIIALTMLPALGLAVYWWFGPQRAKRQRLRRLHGRAALGTQAEVQALLAEHGQAPDAHRHHVQLIAATCGIPPSSADRVQLLQNGVAKLASLLEAVTQARHHVHLEYYIYEPDEIGTRLRDALVERLRAGVTVRLLVDAVGSPHLSSRRGRAFLQDFLALGGQFAVFHPARMDRLRPLVNLRSHRKIVVCDGRIGFLGGINITRDENEEVCAEAYRDTHVRLEGPAVRWLQYVFLEDWVYARGPGERALLQGDLIVAGPPGRIAVQVIASGPDTGGEAIHRSMIDAITNARRRVWLATPYFVPTEPALYALIDAALGGVDVRLLVPRRADSRLVTSAMRSYFDELLKAGVKVYEYLPCMMHAKTLVIDDDYAQVGSANYDHRSFRLNFEVAVALFDRALNAELAAAFERDQAEARAARPSGRLPWHVRLEQAVARLFSPLL